MYRIETEIDLDRKVREVIKHIRLLSPTLDKEDEDYLIGKVYEYMMMSDGVIDMQNITTKLTIEYIDKQFHDKSGESFQVLYIHKSDRPMYQKRIFSVQQELKKSFPTIKTFIVDQDSDFNYVIYVENKRIFNSKKFKEVCQNIEKEYKLKYENINYTIKLKGDN